MFPQRKENGFSLIELLMVLTIILIVAAIAIPKLLTVKQQANAAAAAGNLKTLNNSLSAYAAQYASVGYPASLTALGPPASGSSPSSSAADLIDANLAGSGTTPKQGYIFTYTPGTDSPVSSYTISAAPQGGNSQRYYFTDESGVIRYNDGAAATVTSNIIG